MKVRTQLRHLRQTDSLQRYLARFNELAVQLKNMSEVSKLTAFIDGLKKESKYAVEQHIVIHWLMQWMWRVA